MTRPATAASPDVPGSVMSLADKLQAERIAKRVLGVQAIANDLEEQRTTRARRPTIVTRTFARGKPR